MGFFNREKAPDPRLCVPSAPPRSLTSEEQKELHQLTEERGKKMEEYRLKCFGELPIKLREEILEEIRCAQICADINNSVEDMSPRERELRYKELEYQQHQANSQGFGMPYGLYDPLDDRSYYNPVEVKLSSLAERFSYWFTYDKLMKIHADLAANKILLDDEENEWQE